MMSPDSRLPSILDSPPLVMDTSPDKGIKDFNRQYLNQGMWPSKDNHEILSSARGMIGDDRSMMGSEEKFKSSISFYNK